MLGVLQVAMSEASAGQMGAHVYMLQDSLGTIYYLDDTLTGSEVNESASADTHHSVSAKAILGPSRYQAHVQPYRTQDRRRCARPASDRRCGHRRLWPLGEGTKPT